MNKVFCKLGIVVSIVIVIVGLFLLAGSFPSFSYKYDSGFEVFGADFYTYVNNNVAQAVALIRVASGILIMSIGAIGLCLFGALVGNKSDAFATQSTTVTETLEDSKQKPTSIEDQKEALVE